MDKMKVGVENREFTDFTIIDMIEYYNQLVTKYGKANVSVYAQAAYDGTVLFDVWAYRDETDEEMNKRINKEAEIKRMAKEKREKEKAAREAKEREQYEKLKAKYG